MLCVGKFHSTFLSESWSALSDLIYKTPDKQRSKNDNANRTYDVIFRLGVPKINKPLNMDNDTVIKCVYVAVSITCHAYFPFCDGTQCEYKEQKGCRETCLNFIHICGRIWDVFARAYSIRN